MIMLQPTKLILGVRTETKEIFQEKLLYMPQDAHRMPIKINLEEMYLELGPETELYPTFLCLN